METTQQYWIQELHGTNWIDSVGLDIRTTRKEAEQRTLEWYKNDNKTVSVRLVTKITVQLVLY